MRKLLALMLLALPLAAQVQTINATDNGAVSLSKINGNFSYLNVNVNSLSSSKTARWYGSGAPGSFPLSVRGDFYQDITNLLTYQCWSLTACSGVSPSAWQLVSGGGGGAVARVFGRTGSVVAQSGDYTTDLVVESGSLYFTTGRAQAAISASAPLGYSGGALSLPMWGTGTRPVAANALGTSGNCVQWLASGLGDAGASCGSGSGLGFGPSGSPVSETPAGTLNGVNAAFALTYTPVSATLWLTRNGIVQKAGVDYTLSSNTITFTFIPQTGDILLANYYTAGSTCSTCTNAIAYGTAALGTSSIASGACATTVTVSASGVASTDAIQVSFNADPTSTTGYLPSTSGMLTIIPWPTTNNVNFKVCNNTLASITPGSVTLNWRVAR